MLFVVVIGQLVLPLRSIDTRHGVLRCSRQHLLHHFICLQQGNNLTRDLHDLGIRGRLATFIENFLADRWIQVRVGSTLSEKFDQAQGVPQGSILSTTLLNIKINSIMGRQMDPFM